MELKIKITSDFIESLAKDETIYSLFFVSLISSDNILTKEDAEKSLAILEEIDGVIDDADISDETKEKFKKYTKDGISICKEDIKRFMKDTNVDDVKLKDRTLQVGDNCEYVSCVINGTGMTCGHCHVEAVVDPVNKVYRLVENDVKPREWVLQDIDQDYYINKIKESKTFGEVRYILLPNEKEQKSNG